MMKPVLILLLAVATALPLAAAAGACGDTVNAQNLRASQALKNELRGAFLRANPSIHPELVGAPVAGRTYFGYHVGIRFAVATFAVPGRSADPAIFSDQGRGRWRLLRVTHGGVCSGVVPVDLIRTWWLVHWRGGCYVEPSA